jgi:membrane-anchored protein YejM (alkaline phosphatase superfamily)
VRRSLTLFAVHLAAFSILRLAFLAAFRPHPLARPDLLRALYLGLKFDARLAAIVALPLLFFWSLAYVIAAEALLAVIYAADFGTYAYVHERLNAGVLEFLRNPVIAVHMVWESYHVVWLALAIVAFIAGVVLLVRQPSTGNRQPRAPRIALALFFLACIYGKFSRYPLRWSDAYFSRDDFLGELALNPAQYLFETMREEPPRLDVARVRALYPLIADYVGVKPDPRTLSLARTPPVHRQVRGAPNVVLIQLESFAAYKSGAFGNRANGCPSFDAVARGGILFTNAYSPSEKTARALFAVVFGIPDVSPWQASAHNPLTVDQATIANAFTGYDKLYFLGGSANWSNIRGMLEHNIDGLRIFEEGSYSAPVVDVWGISDEDLLLAANDVFRRERKPFFAIVQTAGNHRPYTIPQQTHGFAVVRGDEAALRANGFESNEEYNSFRYLDHALGLFFESAGREPYFANTVFVLYGDHGTRTGAPPAALTLGDLSLLVYHVPLVIYAPGLGVAPRRIDVAASHVDILPTVAGFCGRPYRNQTLGIDLFDPQRAARSAAFVFTTFHEPPAVGVVQGSRYVINGPLAEAFYETARWLLYHNKRMM